MTQSPSVCQWCSAPIATDILYTLRFKCGTVKEGGKQYQSERCTITVLTRENQSLRDKLEAVEAECDPGQQEFHSFSLLTRLQYILHPTQPAEAKEQGR